MSIYIYIYCHHTVSANSPDETKALVEIIVSTNALKCIDAM